MAMIVRLVVRVNGKPAVSADCVYVGQPGTWLALPLAVTPADLADRVYGGGIRPAFAYDRITFDVAVLPSERRRRWWRRRDRF